MPLSTIRCHPVTPLLLGVAVLCAGSCGGSSTTEPQAVATKFAVTALTDPVIYRFAADIRVSAEDATGRMIGTYAGTVHFTSTDADAQLPPDYSYTASDLGTHRFTVVLRTQGTQTVIATDVASSSVAGSVTVTVGPAPAVALEMTGLPAAITGGNRASGVVTLKDTFGNVATGYTGRVHFTSSDPGADLPLDHAFVAADHGTYAFGVTFWTAGNQTVTATDAAASSLTALQTVGVDPPPASIVISGLPSATSAATPLNGVITMKDAAGHAVPGYVGTVHFSATDPNAALPADYTFTVADAGVHAFPLTFWSGGNQTMTVADVNRSSLTSAQPISVAQALYVANQRANTIGIFAADATGDATPTASSTCTCLVQPYGIGFDGSGRLFVANYAWNMVSVLPPGATGAGAPERTILGATTGLSGPQGLAVANSGQLYVTNSSINRVTVYAAGATGDAAPIATIEGAATGLASPWGIAVDPSGVIYVANNLTDAVTVYAAGASGNAAPIATIRGISTGLFHPKGLALDGAGRIYVASSNGVAVFAGDATGNAVPVASMVGSNTGITDAFGMALDATGRLYLSNILIGSTISYSINIYAAGATGNAAPIATITGPSTGLDWPAGIAFR